MLTQKGETAIIELLAAADREFAAREMLNGSLLMWKATERAITAVAEEQNLPYVSDEDFDGIIRLLDHEIDGDITLMEKYGFARTLRHNATIDFIKDYEVKILQAGVVSLVNHLIQQAARQSSLE